MEDCILPGQRMYRAGNSGKILHISPVITGESQEGADFRGSLGRGNFPYGCQERGIRQETLLGDPVAQVADLLSSKGAFVSPQLEVGVPEPLKDLAKSSEMLFPSGREDGYIVKVEQARLPVEAGEDAIHEAGEGGRCIAKTEGDLIKLVQLATAGTKCGLCLIILRDGHLPVPTLEVKG